MTNDKVLSLIGLCKKAGKLKSGEFSVEEIIKVRKAKLVLVALDASENTKKKYKDMCSYRNIPIYFYSDKATLGKWMGSEERAAVGITDDGFAGSIILELEKNNSDSEVVE